MENTLYKYQEVWGGEKPPGRYIICGEKTFVTNYIKRKEFTKLFGGYVVWKVNTKFLFFSHHKSIGVYGKRNTGKFKRLLMERGAKFNVIEGPEPKSKISYIVNDGLLMFRRLLR